MTAPLHIAFVWHMHQPYYKTPDDGAFELPWVRLHAIKDYVDMVEILGDYPTVHQTFNLVPSLVEQLQDYQTSATRDLYWEHGLTRADRLTPEQRQFVVDRLCEESSHPRAQRHPRYLELARKRERCLERGLESCAQEFSVQELRDLQVWFDLSWFDPVYLEQEPLVGLVDRGRDFSEDDKRSIEAVQRRILARVLPAYRTALERGQIELTTSPYYHPILPLLVNTDSARIARADIPLPPRRYAHAEDAIEQIRAGLAYHADVFGSLPQGMWCSEQAVGEDVIPLLAEAGIRWTISDEGVLARSLGTDIARDESGRVRDPDLLYRPYVLEREGRRIEVVFRDRVLSDLVGFTYSSWDARDAAADLVWRLNEIRGALSGSPEPHLVTIALDGENAWEYYHADGRDFLGFLYEALAADPGFNCVTVAEFLDEAQVKRELPWLHTGSWIYADLSTWIGDPAHSVAWDLLHRTRDMVATHRAGAADPSRQDGVPAREAAAQAWRHVLVAQGSDWFWWFGEHQESGMDHVWDARFRSHLREAYRLLGSTPPLDLHTPVLGVRRPEEGGPPSAHFTPLIDGRVSWPEEWAFAGVCRAARWGAMHAGEARMVDELRYGCDEHDFFLLVVPGGRGFSPGTTIAVYFGTPPADDPGGSPVQYTDRMRFPGRSQADAELGFDASWELAFTVAAPAEIRATLAGVTEGEWGTGDPWSRAALGDVLEAAVPLERVGIDGSRRLELMVAVTRDGILAEVLPAHGAACMDLSAVAERGRTTDGPPAPSAERD